MSDSWLIGEVARVAVAITDAAGVAADPGALRLKVKPPSGPVVTYTYGAGPDVVRTAAGVFHLDLVLAAAGAWYYRWETDSPNAGAAEGALTVRASRVV